MEECTAGAARHARTAEALEQRVRVAEAEREEAQQRAERLVEHSEQEQRALATLVRRAAAKLRSRQMGVEMEVGYEEEELLDGIEGAAGSVASVEGLIVLFERVLEARVDGRPMRRPAEQQERGGWVREREWRGRESGVVIPLSLPPLPPAAVDEEGDRYRSRLRAMQQKYEGAEGGGVGAGAGRVGMEARKSLQERVRLVQQTFQSLRAEEQLVL